MCTGSRGVLFTVIEGVVSRGPLNFCVNYARIIKVYSLIFKITLKKYIKGINSISKRRR